MTPDGRGGRGYSGGVGLFKWLYRLPGRVTGSFGPTAAGASVVVGRANTVSTVGVKAVMGEIENTTTRTTEGSHADDLDQPQDPVGR